MSDAFFASLPRFDTETVVPPNGRQMRILLGQEVEDEPVPDLPLSDMMDDTPALEDVQVDAAAPVEEAVPDQGEIDLSEVEALIASLSDTIARTENDAHAQAVRLVRSIADRLFPELSDLFLAEEIGRHLPGLIPAAAQGVEVHASPALCERLQEVIGRNEALASRCTFVPAESLGQSDACVSWKTGGLTFDFDGLLKACFARLDTMQATMDE
ncbi:MAG TPA: hypothetical protein PLR76_00390 [Hyphomonas sp.]|nr:hypothetical protein [Hyphomonas sp.]